MNVSRHYWFSFSVAITKCKVHKLVDNSEVFLPHFEFSMCDENKEVITLYHLFVWLIVACGAKIDSRSELLITPTKHDSTTHGNLLISSLLPCSSGKFMHHLGYLTLRTGGSKENMCEVKHLKQQLRMMTRKRRNTCPQATYSKCSLDAGLAFALRCVMC